MEAWKKEKLVCEGDNEFVRYGLAATQGWRNSMEDELVAIPDWWPGEVSFFAIYDGHDGSSVSRFCAKYLHVELRKAIDSCGDLHNQLHDCLKQTFLRMDDLMRTKAGQVELARLGKLDKLSDDREEMGVNWDDADLEDTAEWKELSLGGAAAIVGLIFKDRVVVANAGDCRCVLSTQGKAVELSRDHKSDMELEKKRIAAAGGDVWRGRICGLYDASRGLGNFVFKARDDLPAEEQMISAEPEIQEMRLSGGKFLVFGSDGIWPPREGSSQEVVTFVNNEKRFQGIGLSDICLDFIEAYIARAPHLCGCTQSDTEVVIEAGKSNNMFGTDNMSMIVVDLQTSPC